MTNSQPRQAHGLRACKLVRVESGGESDVVDSIFMNCKNEQHDYENAIRKGRAHYVCPKCGKDITLELVLMEQMRRMEAEPSNIENTGEDYVVNKLMDEVKS